MREGSDVTIVACGQLVVSALEAADKLAASGVSAEVINMSTVKPLDGETLLRSVRKTGAAVTAEEHSIIGGLGSAVCEFLSENLPVPVCRVGTKDIFGESGEADELLVKYGLTADGIADAAV